jgi:DMSO reductase family type II enzyme chaperone
MEIQLRGSDELTAGARSSLYGLLAVSLSFPTPGLAAALADGTWAAQTAEIASRLPFELEITALDLASIAAKELEQEYIRLFEVGAGGPFCPLYEGSHRPGRMKIMEELVRFYEHFALQHATEDQPDHLCAELEFMHYLCFKEAAVSSRGQTGGLRLAQRDFLSRHPGKWLPRVEQRLEGAQPEPVVYRSLVALAAAACRCDLAWLKECREKPDPEIGRLPD